MWPIPRPARRFAEVTAVAHARGVPVIVDAAAQLPPQANLRRFIAEGADLVAFSGGKALGGPQASGILAGRRDLVMAAALQHLDLDVFWDMWEPPPSLIDKSRLKGAPQHGIGRSCKAGKEEIVGLLTALRLFIAEGDAARHARWLKDCETVAAALEGHLVTVTGGNDTSLVPTVEITPDPERMSATAALPQAAARRSRHRARPRRERPRRRDGEPHVPQARRGGDRRPRDRPRTGAGPGMILPQR